MLIRPKRSTLKSRAQVSLVRTFKFKHAAHEWTGVPIIASNMDTVATFEMARALASHKCFTTVHKHYSVEDWVNFAKSEGGKECLEYMSVSCGTSDEDFEKIKAVIAATGIKFICIDVANGYSEHFVEHLKKVRAQFPQHVIMAGNVVTGEMTEELILSGADIVKVGIGPGSVCTTRKQTGVGYPQLSAVIECADAAHGLGGLVIADGGCAVPGDVAKAFGAGADFVMLGGMLAGHDECGGEAITDDSGAKFILFYGMSSATAQEKHAGGVHHYRSSEGKTVRVPYRGSVNNTMFDILGGIRSACTYVGASALKDLSKRTTFIRVTEQLNQVFSAETYKADSHAGVKRKIDVATADDINNANKK